MYPISQGEKLIETKVCRQCQISFPITDKDIEFYDKASPIFSGKKYQIPTPTLCPDCRTQRRLAWRNERKLYKRETSNSHVDVISVYSPDKPYVIYDQKTWWSDSWDVMMYGRDFSFEVPFLDQFSKMRLSVPVQALYNRTCENSEYGNLNTEMKNCYLCFATGYSKDCQHLSTSAWCKNTIDGYWSLHTEQSYEIIDSIHCYNSYHINSSIHIRDSQYIWNCENLSNSTMCVNLKGGSNFFLNKQYDNEAYVKILNTITTDAIAFSRAYTEYKKLILSIPVKNPIWNSTKCSGSYISNSNNCNYCFDCAESTDCKYCSYVGLGAKTCYDISCDTFQSELAYESSIVPLGYHMLFSYNCWTSSELAYCIDCYDTKNCFGCIGLRNKQYCILNKQYTKEQYEELVPKIIEHMTKTGEWGEFFPAPLSPFGYNETVASEYFPLDKNEATKKGFNWSNYEAPFPKVEKIILASKLPDDIKKIPDDILNWAIECEVTGKPFRIVKSELEFYRLHNLSIPRRHPDQRHFDRVGQRNPRKLFERKCDKCQKDILTTYNPERPEVVYCEECYNREVI